MERIRDFRKAILLGPSSEIPPGPETAADVKTMLAFVDAEVKAASDPEWFEKYGDHFALYTRLLFSGDAN